MGSKEAMAKKEAVDAMNEKNQAAEEETLAQRTLTSGSFVADRYRTLTAAITEREQKRKTSQLAVAEDEKRFKVAADEAAAESAKCRKMKDANANIGKAMALLK